ncbi:MAG: hypothetical protein A2X12_00020 [Bacteroidetes bacterium GWE2_29_8]|nr:MAG: hypothetical protein A2X12_00020 [Bacteroidetes bacterium GWE2_29_8]OFY16598.1 MAG: hypothetical protein A2X02_05525 [Bacteroidetes bacterium GWF2_29_10]
MKFYLIVIITLFSVSLYSQSGRKSERINKPGQNLMLAGDNAITGLALQTLGTFIVIADFKLKSPNSENTIKGIGYGFIGAGAFYYVKAYVRIRKAGKLLSYNDNILNRKKKKQLFDINISPNNISLCLNL